MNNAEKEIRKIYAVIIGRDHLFGVESKLMSDDRFDDIDVIYDTEEIENIYQTDDLYLFMGFIMFLVEYGAVFEVHGGIIHPEEVLKSLSEEELRQLELDIETP